MEYIAHRVNTIKKLSDLPKEYGVEIDLRDYKDRLILSHDPFCDGENFEEYLKNYNHGTMILNIKSERIEFKVLELLKKYNIDNYFFLDSSFPMINLLTEQLNEPNIALRYSEYEGLDTILNMQGKIKWVWVDCFTKNPLIEKDYNILKDNGYQICFVSPDLVGRPEDIESYKQEFLNNNINLDAVCVKYNNFDKWK
ncbi:MAG: hypothetical protein GY817_01290 [bacterium]|nr:hypothetical protein [bacterium]